MTCLFCRKKIHAKSVVKVVGLLAVAHVHMVSIWSACCLLGKRLQMIAGAALNVYADYDTDFFISFSWLYTY